MITFTACPTCAEDVTGVSRCPICWAKVETRTLDPRSADHVLTPLDRRVNHRLRRALDEMHAREIAERTLALVRTS